MSAANLHGSPMSRLLDRFDLGIDPSEVAPAAMRRIRIIAMASLALCGIGVPTIVQYWRLGATSVVSGCGIAMTAAMRARFAFRAELTPRTSWQFSKTTAPA